MSFNSARNKLTDARKAALDSLLADWDGSTDIRPQVAANLRAEFGSDIDPLADYLAVLADKKAELDSAAHDAKDIFQQIGKIFALAGHEAAPHKDAIFGRAILVENFVRYLQGTLYKLGLTDTPDDILRNLQSLDDKTEATAPSASRIYFKAIRQTALGKDAVFATFAKPVRANERPWVRPPPDANTIRNTIALGEDGTGKDYILFAYRLPDGTPRVPTTASPGWSYQKWFRPNPAAATELHGWTEPIGTGFVKRPEIVHSEKDVTTLVFPIHIAKA
jgi:hypothetical protein